MAQDKENITKIHDVPIRAKGRYHVADYLDSGKEGNTFPHWDDIPSHTLNNYIQLLNRWIGTKDENSISSKDLTLTTSASSDFRVDKDGSLSENWTSVETIPAKLIEVNNDFIIMECLVDAANKVFQTRQFKKSFLPLNIKLKVDLILFLKVFERPGKISIELIESPSTEFEKYFAVDPDEYKDINAGKFLK